MAGRLQRRALIDADELGAGGQIVNQPGGVLTAADATACAQRLDVAFDLRLELAVDGGMDEGRRPEGDEGCDEPGENAMRNPMAKHNEH